MGELMSKLLVPDRQKRRQKMIEQRKLSINQSMASSKDETKPKKTTSKSEPKHVHVKKKCKHNSSQKDVRKLRRKKRPKPTDDLEDIQEEEVTDPPTEPVPDNEDAGEESNGGVEHTEIKQNQAVVGRPKCPSNELSVPVNDSTLPVDSELEMHTHKYIVINKGVVELQPSKESSGMGNSHVAYETTATHTANDLQVQRNTDVLKDLIVGTNVVVERELQNHTELASTHVECNSTSQTIHQQT